MAVTVFKDASYNVSGLLSRIQHGEIALPDIQRPVNGGGIIYRRGGVKMYHGRRRQLVPVVNGSRS